MNMNISMRMTNRVDSAVVCQDDARQQATVNMTNITVDQPNMDGQQGHHVIMVNMVMVNLFSWARMVTWLQGHHSHSVNSRIVRLAPGVAGW